LALLLVSAKFAETVDQATIVLDLVGDNSLAILKISYREIVSRTLTQSIGNFAFESRVSPLQIGDGCLRHGSLQHSRIHAEKNVKKQRLFDMDQGAGWDAEAQADALGCGRTTQKRPQFSIEVKLSRSERLSDRDSFLNAL
jgi:hypothetical protein